jgi:hypothetical protein
MRALNTAATALLARLQAGEQVPMVRLVEMSFPVVERYTTAGHALTWGGHTWEPLGLVIEPVQDSAAEMPGLALTLPGVTPDAVALALSEDVEGTALRVWDALVDPDTGAVADAVLCWAGRLNVPSLADGRTATISLTAEHRGTVALRAKSSRYTNDEQQRLYPGDTSLAGDPATDAAPIVWPARSFFLRP